MFVSRVYLVIIDVKRILDMYMQLLTLMFWFVKSTFCDKTIVEIDILGNDDIVIN